MSAGPAYGSWPTLPKPDNKPFCTLNGKDLPTRRSPPVPYLRRRQPLERHGPLPLRPHRQAVHGGHQGGLSRLRGRQGGQR
jgi:hypothetical protein